MWIIISIQFYDLSVNVVTSLPYPPCQKCDDPTLTGITCSLSLHLYEAWHRVGKLQRTLNRWFIVLVKENCLFSYFVACSLNFIKHLTKRISVDGRTGFQIF